MTKQSENQLTGCAAGSVNHPGVFGIMKDWKSYEIANWLDTMTPRAANMMHGYSSRTMIKTPIIVRRQT